jgi:L-malate glycosyltransferase
MKKVVIITRLLPQYRIDFINRLKTELAQNGVELSYIYGKSKNEDALKKDEIDLEWGTYVKNNVWNVGGVELIWQPCLSHLADKDLIIVEQANRNLINYVLIFQKLVKNKKFAYWGHGRNMQVKEHNWRNKFKTLFLRQCDWWFAYTQGVKKSLINASYPADKITCVQNAIDTAALRKEYEGIKEEDLIRLKRELGITSENTVIYCGGIYKEKRIAFLLEACDKIRKKVKDLHVIIIGSGVDSHLVEKAAQSRPWIHYLGPKFGLERARYFKISTLTLMPGLVGLGILDTFAMETPIITTDYPYHSPEIEYLHNGENGIMVKNNLDDYVRAVVETLNDPLQRIRLSAGCYESSLTYTVEQMVKNFSSGVLQALGQKSAVFELKEKAHSFR